MDDKLPEILVLNSKCLMAEKFGILFTRVRILAPKNGYAVRALNLGLNHEASRALGKCAYHGLLRSRLTPTRKNLLQAA